MADRKQGAEVQEV